MKNQKILQGPASLEEAIARHAISTMKCSLCGSELYLRRVIDDFGLISQDVIELFDYSGHIVSCTRNLLEKIKKEKECNKPAAS